MNKETVEEASKLLRQHSNLTKDLAYAMNALKDSKKVLCITHATADEYKFPYSFGLDESRRQEMLRILRLLLESQISEIETKLQSLGVTL